MMLMMMMMMVMMMIIIDTMMMTTTTTKTTTMTIVTSLIIMLSDVTFASLHAGVTLLEKLMTNHTMTVRGWRLPSHADDVTVKMCLVEMRKVLVESTVVMCNKHNTEKILEQVSGECNVPYDVKYDLTS
jgi:hypothetical protein